MSILYSPENHLLTLHTRHSTYQMCMDEYGFLRHLYYGERVDGADFRYLLRDYDRGFSGNPIEFRNNRGVSQDTTPQEYTGFNAGDYRVPALCAVHADGSYAADLRYAGHEIRSGAYSLPGLPAAFDRSPDDSATLVVTLRDTASALQVHLYYGVFEERDIITRAAEIVNGGDSVIYLEKAASACVDFLSGNWELLHFHGRHCMERQPQRVPLSNSVQSVESRRGMSSHHHNPFTILCAPETREYSGECYGFMLLWSGNHKTEFEKDYLNSVRVVTGIHDSQFRWNLGAGEHFFTPQVMFSYSASGFSTLSHQYHDMIRYHVCRSQFVHKRRPVLINNWEATMFSFDTERLLNIARQAAELGVELFVMDDGWFGRRDGEDDGLGDWFVNENKLPGGLNPLIQGLKDLGMSFGLWIEPEMVNEASDLYRVHPEWALTAPNRLPVYGRNQLVLDMSRKDVRDYLYNCFAGLLRNYDISYIKWDMNRCLTDVYSHELPAERQGEMTYRYVLGVYDLAERLTQNFPDVLFEGCAGGGGRFDAGMLYYVPQIWCSDDTDAIERLDIQHGTSFGYPPFTMGSHVSACPNQQTGRTTSLYTRGVVAMPGTFGYELDLNRLSSSEKDEVRLQMAYYKKVQSLIQNGVYYRLNELEEQERYSAWEFAAPDGSEILVNLVVKRVQANAPLIRLRLKGLSPAATYALEDTESRYLGAALMTGGYTFPMFWGDYPALQLHFTRVD
ncbi:MAG: alpha-galactosidase [Oscillospiraceae bacterium]|nr:alpha-galactosidase [Oscillospiraceae bacterium]